MWFIIFLIYKCASNEYKTVLKSHRATCINLLPGLKFGLLGYYQVVPGVFGLFQGFNNPLILITRSLKHWG